MFFSVRFANLQSFVYIFVYNHKKSVLKTQFYISHSSHHNRNVKNRVSVNMQKSVFFLQILQIVKDLNKIKEIPNTILQTLIIIRKITKKNHQKKYSSRWQLELVKTFFFFRQNTQFFGSNKDLSKFLRGVLHYLVIIIKLI